MFRKLLLFDLGVVAAVLLLVGLRASLIRGIYPDPFLYFWSEAASSLLALVVVYVGLRGFAESGSRRLLSMGIGFLIFAVLEALHGLTAPGGFRFFLPDDEHVSIWLWQAGRLLGALVLFVGVLLRDVDQAPRPRPAGARATLVLSALSVCLLIVLAGSVGTLEAFLPDLWQPGTGATQLTVVLDWITLVTQVVVTVAFLQRYLRLREDALLFFAFGLFLLALAGSALVSDRTFYALGFWIAQGYKLVAYLSFSAGILALALPRIRKPLEGA